MSIIDDIDEQIFNKKIQEEAKKVPRKELEELYVKTKYEYTHRVSPIYARICVTLVFITLITIATAIAMSLEYENSETTNYRTFATDICEKEQLGKYRSIGIREEEIKVICYNGDYKIPIQ